MDSMERTAFYIDTLKTLYPDTDCTLNYDPQKPYQLLFNTRLAAQCTDARVNIVAQDLYRIYPTLESLANADLEDLEAVIRPCGFYHLKARDIIECAGMLLRDYDGKIPSDMESLLKLPGVGKTANLILGDLYHHPSAVVTDTHCIRLSNRLGLCSTKDPVKVESALRALLPPEESNDFCHRLVDHGRAVCKAARPQCGECALSSVCPKAGVKA